jgi:serine/threonine protein kinase
LSELSRGTSVGRYLVLDRLGTGGMGVVYKAFDPELDRPIALKLLQAADGSEGASERLLREAQALARLTHPNVIAVYDVGMFGGDVFIAMEFVEGQTLREWIKQDTRSRAEVVDAFLAAGEGLAAAHRAGLVHRDFKPDNVMLGTDGRARVLDFGLARTADANANAKANVSVNANANANVNVNVKMNVDATVTAKPRASVAAAMDASQSGRISANLLSSPLTHVGAIVGTPRFMAPEQHRGEAVDERADQFSFCVALYWALYRSFPFTGDTPEAILESVLTGRVSPPPPGSTVPRWLRQVILRGLELDPARRFPSMAELLRALRADPTLVRRRWLARAALIAVPLALLATWGRVKQGQGTVCRGGERKLVGVWDRARRAEVQAAFQRTGKASAAEWFTIAAANLDAYARKWVAARQEACEATRIHGEQSEEVLDLRMTCLESRLTEVHALVSALGTVDASSVQEAPRATQALSAVEDCADVAALRSPTARPRGAAERAQVDKLEKRLAEVQALYNLGKLSAATSASAQLVTDALALGFGPLVAQAHLWQGRTFADTYDGAHAVASFHAAFSAALASGEATVLDEAAVRVAQEYLYARNRTEYQAWDELASAALRRFPNLKRASFLEQVRCVGLSEDGKVLTCLRCLRDHAAELDRRGQLTDWELTWLGLAAADAGQYAEGVKWVRRGVAYSAEHEGKLHPRTLELRAYLVRALAQYGDAAEATREGEETLAAVQREGLGGSTLEAKVSLYLGMALRALGRRADAEARLQVAHREERDPEIRSEASPELVGLYLETGRVKEAIALAQKSLAQDEKSLSPTHPYVLTDGLALARAQLRVGGSEAARATLERLLKAAANGNDRPEVNPFLLASLKAELGVALGRAEAGRSRTLLSEARATWAGGPPTKRFSDERSRLDELLAQAMR